jgi:hypothetical protein
LIPAAFSILPLAAVRNSRAAPPRDGNKALSLKGVHDVQAWLRTLGASSGSFSLAQAVALRNSLAQLGSLTWLVLSRLDINEATFRQLLCLRRLSMRQGSSPGGAELSHRDFHEMYEQACMEKALRTVAARHRPTYGPTAASLKKMWIEPDDGARTHFVIVHTLGRELIVEFNRLLTLPQKTPRLDRLARVFSRAKH